MILCKQKHRFILTNAYESILYSIKTTCKADRQAFAMFPVRKMTFSKFSKMQMFLSTQSYLTFQDFHFQ